MALGRGIYVVLTHFLLLRILKKKNVVFANDQHSERVCMLAGQDLCFLYAHFEKNVRAWSEYLSVRLA